MSATAKVLTLLEGFRLLALPSGEVCDVRLGVEESIFTTFRIQRTTKPDSGPLLIERIGCSISGDVSVYLSAIGAGGGIVVQGGLYETSVVNEAGGTSVFVNCSVGADGGIYSQADFENL